MFNAGGYSAYDILGFTLIKHRGVGYVLTEIKKLVSSVRNNV